MIAQAKSIPYGHTYCLYISGEAVSKKEPEKVYHVCDNLVSPMLPALGLYDELKDACRCRPNITNTVIRIVVSPSPEYTKDFTMDDWRDLWVEFVREFDGIELSDETTGKVYSPHTNIAGSRHSVWLHMESKSGVPHLHAAVARVDEEGNTNNDHDIHLRAQRAAEQVALRRGWTTAASIREDNLKQVTQMCFDALQSMDHWSFDDYVSIIESHGFDVKTRADKDGVVRGYILKKGNHRYKASEISRKLTMRYIEDTWQKLHSRQQTVTPPTHTPQPHQTTDTNGSRAANNDTQDTRPSVAPTSGRYSYLNYMEPRLGTRPFTFNLDGQSLTLHLPDSVMDVFDTEFASFTPEEALDLKGIAIAIFTLMIGGLEEAYVESGGGGSSNQSGWGEDRDDDDRKRAFAAAHAAIARSAKPRSSRRRRQ